MMRLRNSNEPVHNWLRSFLFPMALLSSLAFPALLVAQGGGFVTGTVHSSEGRPIVGAAVQLQDGTVGTLTNSSGVFRLGPLTPGSHALLVTSLGYEPTTLSIRVGGEGATAAEFILEARPVALAGVRVSVLRPDMRPEGQLQGDQVRQANPRDVGEALRVLPGVDAVRRGPLGLDPVVRGLRETEVGVYLDGTRQFPAGPARMDSPLTHLDPSALERVEVVKGPYALTWGAGNMSAIRVETQPVPPPVPGAFHGRALLGYDENLGAVEGSASLSGESGPTAYWLHGAWREGNDYEAGAGELIPADFLSREIRGKLGYRLAPGSWMSLSGGYQQQDDLDYPGRLLNAEFFHAANMMAEWSLERPTGALRLIEALIYANDVDHKMNNDEKPTAQPMEGRMPPFALNVEVESEARVQGGRLATVLHPASSVELEVGGDFYRADRNAVRSIANRETGMLMMQDLMWPDATIVDAGVFGNLSRSLRSGVSVSGTIRVDQVWAAADTATDFFRANVSGDLESTETNLSGAVVASYQPTPGWSASLGAGSVVRTADATERYSDRIPSSKAQTSAEFMGNPDLAPERSTQADLWIEGAYPRVSLSLNAFVRRIDDYITLEPTDLERKLPLSPEIVYRYVNGEAEFWGGEVTAAARLLESLTLSLAASYLRGTDTSLGEPALGVTPPRALARVRWEPAAARYYVQSTLQAVAEQDRVASSRGELPTQGYTTLDAEAGLTVMDGGLLRIGVRNLFDTEYVNHLNAKNPFTGIQLPEPGRVVFARVSYTF